MKKTLTRILALCARPSAALKALVLFGGYAICGLQVFGATAKVGDTVTWSNTGTSGALASDASGTVLNECNFDFCIPGTTDLPAGSVVRITKIRLASVNTTFQSWATTKHNSDFSYIKLNNIQSAGANGCTVSSSQAATLVDTEKIQSKATTEDYALSFTFSNTCDIEVGKNYPAATGNNASTGLAFLYHNGNLCYGSSTDQATCRFVNMGEGATSVISSTTYASTYANYYPVYEITATVVSIAIDVSGETTVAAINEKAGSQTSVILHIADGATIDYGTDTFTATTVKMTSSGSFTLKADAQPASTELAKLDLSGVEGKVTRTWMTTSLGIVGMNFNAGAVRTGSGTASGSVTDTSGALASGGTWYSNSSDSSGTQAISADGLTKLTWGAKNLWTENTTSGALTSFIQAYLDDGTASPGTANGPIVTITGIPYDEYDVIIYCATDTAGNKFKSKQVNGTWYAWDSTTKAVISEGVTSSTIWGSSDGARGVPNYGDNAIRINKLTGKLTIYGGIQISGENAARGCIAAIQIMPTGEGKSYALSLDADADVTWSGASWTGGDSYPTTEAGAITLAGNATITMDKEISPAGISLLGESTSALTIKNGENLTISGSINSTGPHIKATKLVFDGGNVGAAIDVDTDTETELNAAEGKVGSVSGAISGAGKTVKTGAGTITLTGRGTMEGGLTVNSGTLKLGGSGNYSFWAGTAVPVSVATGSTFDINGASGFKSDITLASGATLANTGKAVDTESAQAHGLILNGDATVTTDTQFGLLANGYSATTMTLGANKLTKTGTGDFILCNATVTGAGTIDVTAGTVTAMKGVSAADATINLASGTTLNVNSALTAKVSGSGTVQYNIAAPSGTVTLADDSSVAVKIVLSAWTTASATIPVSGTPASITIVDPDGNTSAATYTRDESTGTITVTVPVVQPLSKTNPVTSDSQSFTWAFRGTADSSWDTAGNWYKVTNYRWAANTADKAPGVSSSSADDPWAAMLFDGNLLDNDSVASTNVEGWAPKYGAFNGAQVSINAQKIQGSGTSFVMVDSTSKITFATVSGGNTQNTVDFYVAAADGVEFTHDFDATTCKGTTGSYFSPTFNYFLAGEGSVKYDGKVEGTHNLSNVTFTVGTGTYKTILNKTLIGYTSKTGTFNVDDATVACSDSGVTATKKTSGDVVPADDLGTYKITVGDKGVVMTYVGYTSNAGIAASRTVGTDTVGYWTLAGAIGAASSETAETITVLKSTSETITLSKSVTLDEAQNYLEGAHFTVKDGYTLTVKVPHYTGDGSNGNAAVNVTGEGSGSTLILAAKASTGIKTGSEIRSIKLSVNGDNDLYMGNTDTTTMLDSTVDVDVTSALYIENGATTIGNLTGTGAIHATSGSLIVTTHDTSSFTGSMDDGMTTVAGDGTMTIGGSNGAMTIAKVTGSVSVVFDRTVADTVTTIEDYTGTITPKDGTGISIGTLKIASLTYGTAVLKLGNGWVNGSGNIALYVNGTEKSPANLMAASDGLYVAVASIYKSDLGYSKMYATFDAAIADLGSGETITVVDSSDAAKTTMTNKDWKFDESGNLVQKVYVAQVGDDKYESVARALEAIETTGTVKLIADVTEYVRYTNNTATAVTLDLNGKTITAPEGGVYTICNSGSAALTITGNGAVINTANNAYDMGGCVWARCGSITIESGAFTNNSAYEATVYIGASTAKTAGAKITINGGTFVNQSATYAHKTGWKGINVNVWNSFSDTSALVANGGTFSQDPSDGDDNKGGSFLATGKIAVLTGDMYVVQDKPEEKEESGVIEHDVDTATAVTNTVAAILKVGDNPTGIYVVGTETHTCVAVTNELTTTTVGVMADCKVADFLDTNQLSANDTLKVYVGEHYLTYTLSAKGGTWTGVKTYNLDGTEVTDTTPTTDQPLTAGQAAILTKKAEDKAVQIFKGEIAAEPTVSAAKTAVSLGCLPSLTAKKVKDLAATVDATSVSSGVRIYVPDADGSNAQYTRKNGDWVKRVNEGTDEKPMWDDGNVGDAEIPAGMGMWIQNESTSDVIIK